MKVLHVEAGRHLYGGARQLAYLVDALAERGIDNVLVIRPEHPVLDVVEHARHVELNFGGDLDLALYARLKRLIEAERPDLVHVHSRRGADICGGVAASAAKTPALLTRRVQSAEPKPWLRLKCKPYARIVAISSAVQAELESAGIAHARIRSIPSAVDTERFRPDAAARARLIDRYALPRDAVIAGAAAQLIPRKGIAELLPLAARWHAEEPRLRLLVFGQGRERRALERRRAALGASRLVRFCGYVADWPALVGGLDVFLHPARREGLGSAVLEAMSAGVPVVASRVGGLVDVIEDGVDGRLLPPAASEQWHACVLDLIKDPEGRKRLGAAARRKVESTFTIDRMTRSYVALYHELARDGGA